MVIHNKTVMIYDIEVFPNTFHCVLLNTDNEELYKFEISERKNQIRELVQFFTNPKYLLCGYNNKHYDDVIINYIIDYIDEMLCKSIYDVTLSLFNLSQTIINLEDGNISKIKRWKYANYFESMDLLTMMFSSKLRVGLKSMQITMQYQNVQEYSGDFGSFLPKDKIDEMISYNINDVKSTYSLFNYLVKNGDIDLRLFIEQEYGFNALSMDSVKFGETLIAKKVCEELHINKRQLEQMRSPMDNIPLKDVILPFIRYKNPKFQEALEDMKKQVVSSKNKKPGEKNYENKFVVSGVRYSIGVGGIHSLNEPRIYVPKEDEYLGHLDVASMYPSFIVRYGWFPRHLGKAGLAVYTQIYHERIQAKHSGQKQKNLALKLTLNSVTGKMQQETSWMYDPFSVFKIRINGQLILLMLADLLLQHSCEIVQVNTDGVMFIAKKAYKDAIMESVAKLEQLTKLSFEADSYEAFYQFAVNDYFGVVDGFSQSRNPKLIEKKGMFITEPVLGKGLAPTIIPEAVINYFVYNIPVEDTIHNCNDIRKFLMSQRVDRKFKVEYDDKYIQRINRWYASTNGCYLYTVDESKTPVKYSNLLKKSGVTILNYIDDISTKNRKINYPYYISEARKIIDQLVCRQLDLFQSC
jgi:hypothetical protein